VHHQAPPSSSLEAARDAKIASGYVAGLVTAEAGRPSSHRRDGTLLLFASLALGVVAIASSSLHRTLTRMRTEMRSV
jgi:hypothetical protein